MNKTSELQQTIHNYCLQSYSAGDFAKNQQILELLRKFILDWNNLPILKSLIEVDCKQETTFVIYQLLQKAIASGCKFVNVLQNSQRKSQSYEEYEINERQHFTTIVTTHLDIVINYFTKGLQHQIYVQNTVLFALAFMLRKYWSEIIGPEQLVEKLINTFFYTQNVQILTLGCKLFENLLSCIRQYYYATGYLEFRKIMMGFQRQSLSTLLEQTHKLVQNQLKIGTFLQIYQLDKSYADSLIQLLNSFLTFNFNLSFYEIDVDHDSKENFIINFPDSYFKIINDEKLNQEYFRAIIDFYPIDQAISIRILNIIQRISSARLSLFFQKHNFKKILRRTLWEGLLFLLNNYELYLNNTDFSNEVCSFAIRLVSNFTLKKLRKFQDLFDQCVNQLNKINQLILNNQGIKLSSNSVFIKLQEVWHQFLFQINIYSSQYLQQFKLLQNSVNLSFKLLIHAFYNGNPFSEIPPNYPIKKIKKFLDKGFHLCIQVYQQNTVECINVISDLLKNLPIMQVQTLQPQEQLITLQKFSSLLCLISALVLSPAQIEYLSGGESQFQQAKIEGHPQARILLQAILDLIAFTNKINIPADNYVCKLYHTSILIFIQTYISQTIENLYFDEIQKTVISQSQLSMNLGNDNQGQQNYLIVIESCLEKCFQIFTFHDPDLVEFSFIILQYTYEKLKRQLDRRFFRQSSISSMLKQFFLQMDLTCFNEVQYIKKRKQVYKLVSLVWVDDQLDDYVPALVDIYKQIKKSITNETNKINMLKYLWDMIGVVDELEVDSIYRVFLRIVFPDLSSLLSTDNTQIFVQDYDSSLGLTALLCSIFKNKNTRLSNENIQILLYQIYGKATTFFITSIDYLILQAQTSIQQGQQVKDGILKMAAKLLKVMGQISSSKQINQGFFVIYQDSSYLNLFKKQLQLIIAYKPLFLNLIKYKKYLFECLEGICSEHSETLAYRCGSDVYLDLLIISDSTLKEILNFKQLKGEEQINEEAIQISQIASILCNVMQFLIQEGVIGEQMDTEMIKKKTLEIYTTGKQVLISLFSSAFTIIVAFPKILKFSTPNCEILFAISLFNPNEFQQLLIQLIQEYKNSIQLQQQTLEFITLGYQVLNNYLNSTTKELFTKQIKQALEQVCAQEEF
ncbi:unnamed protein product [Paramecium primaurelia]|uniref:Uncharacterized protein n=1 Tax=Paramecium primaurelia TaxID=5886 RepID=A0A8S1JT97_PARPR|nr:unnamed protein product [Paramecium primaurelia]